MLRSRLRPVDLARENRLSTQAIRNYEEAGILPPSERTESGYRVYTEVHASALRAFLALVPAHGHPTAMAIMQAVNRGATGDAYGLIDDSHLQLMEDRQTLAAVELALRDLTPVGAVGSEPMFVGPLAHQLRIRPATLRKWENAGLIQPDRDPKTGYRVYSPSDVRDARLVRQLRRGGYLLEQIGVVVSRVREAGGVEPLEGMLAEWRQRLDDRSRAMLYAAGRLDAYLTASAAVSTSVSTSASVSASRE
ncbi:TioE family transcriptional regulator [Flindersiella endophytica]